MIGVLSGFGAVYCPWAYFQMVSLDSKLKRYPSKQAPGSQEGDLIQHYLFDD